MLAYSRIDDEFDYISDMINKGFSAYKISKFTKYSKSTILRFIKRYGLKNQNKCKVDKNNLLKNKEDKVIELHKKGKNQTEIANILGHSQSKINTILKENGYYENNYNYKLNESFFYKIDAEESAYFLGWFFSDGCVDNDGKCRIQIQSEDREIIDSLKSIIKYEGPVYEISPPKKFPYRKSQVALVINRKTLAEDLIKLGCVPNKSLILKYPDWIIGHSLERHFVRGCFDGDGCARLSRGKFASMSLTSSTDFNNVLQTRLKDILDINSKPYFRKNQLTSSLMVNKGVDCFTWHDWMYKDSKFFLTRKKTVFDKIK